MGEIAGAGNRLLEHSFDFHGDDGFARSFVGEAMFEALGFEGDAGEELAKIVVEVLADALLFALGGADDFALEVLALGEVADDGADEFDVAGGVHLGDDDLVNGDFFTICAEDGGLGAPDAFTDGVGEAFVDDELARPGGVVVENGVVVERRFVSDAEHAAAGGIEIAEVQIGPCGGDEIGSGFEECGEAHAGGVGAIALDGGGDDVGDGG